MLVSSIGDGAVITVGASGNGIATAYTRGFFRLLGLDRKL